VLLDLRAIQVQRAILVAQVLQVTLENLARLDLQVWTVQLDLEGNRVKQERPVFLEIQEAPVSQVVQVPRVTLVKLVLQDLLDLME
jgi:hypothetical protein